MIKFIIFLTISITMVVLLQHTSENISFSYNSVLIQISTWKIIAGLLTIILFQYYLFKNAISNWLNNWRIKKTFFGLISGKIITHKNYSAYFKWAESLFSLMRSELYYNKNQYDLALLELNQLHQKFPNKPLILLRITAIYHSLHNWQELIKLLPILKKRNIYSINEHQQLEFKVYKERLEQLSNEDPIKAGFNFFKNSPKTLKQNPEFILSYINNLLKYKHYDLAENIIRTSISNLINYLDFNNINNIDLIKIYGLLKTNNTKQQIKSAEYWLSKQPNNFMLLLTLGRLCISECLWGKAKNYLERGLKIQEDPACYVELARLSKILGESEQSLKCYEKLNNYNL